MMETFGPWTRAPFWMFWAPKWRRRTLLAYYGYEFGGYEYADQPT